MVEQVDRDAAESFYEGPCTRGLLETILSSHRIAAEARGMEKQREIDGKSTDIIRRAAEHLELVKELEATQKELTLSLNAMDASTFGGRNRSDQLRNRIAKIRAALNGGQHE